MYTLRKQLHQLAEPSMQEHQTKQFLMDWLKNNTGLKVVSRGEWFYAVYEPASSDSDTATEPTTTKADSSKEPISSNTDSSKEPVSSNTDSSKEPVSSNTDSSKEPVSSNAASAKSPIAFRADFDAVLCQDGIARHLCGHDGHSAVLASFAKELEELAPDRTVYLIFQPGEETGEGGRICSSLIEEKNIGEIYGFHNIPGAKENQILLLPGTFACASTGMELTFQGSPAHAAYPEQGKNPSLIIADLIRYSQALLKESWKGIVLATIIGVDLGSQSYGVSAEKGVIRFTLRAEYQDEYDALLNKIQTKATELATAEGFDVSIRLIEEFPATMNHPASVEKIRVAAECLGIETSTPKEPFRWSEDFGYYLQKTAGAMFGVGAGFDHPGLHTSEYEFNDAIIQTVLQVFKTLLK